jgi:glutathione S-transferase
MKFYYNPMSNNCRRALATILFNGRTDIEMEVLDFKAGDLKKPEFLAVNPNGKIPALSDGDFSLWESNAIMQYVSSDSSLWPPDKSRYDIARWQFWTSAHFGPALGTIAYERLMKPHHGMGDTDEAKVEEAMTNFNGFAAVLDGALEGKDYLVNDSLTLADFSVASELTYAVPAGVDLAPYPNIQRWLGNLDTVEAWSKSAPQLG